MKKNTQQQLKIKKQLKRIMVWIKQLH